MARTVRFAWRMQGRASGAEWQIAQLRQQLDGVAIRFAAAEEVARTAQEELRKLREQLDGATAHVVAADEVARAAQEELYKLRGSRRVRAALQVGRLYDRARRRG
jgi:chromosome segregation ATPase